MKVRKGYTIRWTKEVFAVKKVLYTNPTTYKITDSGGEEFQGYFYEQELQKMSQEMYRIEHMIKRKSKVASVKWLSYLESQNLWVNLDALERLWTQMCSMHRIVKGNLLAATALLRFAL